MMGYDAPRPAPGIPREIASLSRAPLRFAKGAWVMAPVVGLLGFAKGAVCLSRFKKLRL